MTWIVLFLGIVLFLFWGYIHIGGACLRGQTRPGKPAAVALRWPAVAVIVPAAGAGYRFDGCLESLLAQEYPQREFVFVTCDQGDPAVPVIRKAIRHHPRARLVFSGPATGCGQKNHNLLEGVRAASPSAKVLVFCDSNRLVPSGWLKALVRPLAEGTAPVVSGYHHIRSDMDNLATVGHVCSALLLHLTRGFRLFVQPWGGNVAIERSLFDSIGVARMWSRNVVDDVSLAALLLKKGVAVVSAPDACTVTPLVGESFRHWHRWMLRQWLYLKYCMPLTWVLAGTCCWLVVLSWATAAVLLLGWLLTSWWPGTAAVALLHLIGFSLGFLYARAGYPYPVAAGKWVMASLLTFMLAVGTHLQALVTSEIRWKANAYRVGRGGRVLRVRQPGSSIQ